MWSKREVSAADSTISRVTLSSQSEFDEFVKLNQPAIVCGALNAWLPSQPQTAVAAAVAAVTSRSEPDWSSGMIDIPAPALTRDHSSYLRVAWSIEHVSSILKDTVMKNVMRSDSGRFKYFKSTAAPPAPPAATANDAKSVPVASSPALEEAPPAATTTAAAGTQRLAMRFHEFVAAASASASASASTADCKSASPAVTAGAGGAYYLYGEPLPPVLHAAFPVPKLLSCTLTPSSDATPATDSAPTGAAAVAAIGDAVTSRLLWVAVSGSISPLHFDMSEGILAQIHGSKRVVLIAPSHYGACYPHERSDTHDRQSRVNCIHAPDLKQFREFDGVPAVQGTVASGEFLYIPFGWWHQIESTGQSVSVTVRWNPYESRIKSILTAHSALTAASTITASAKNVILAQLLLQSELPKHVQLLLRNRYSLPIPAAASAPPPPVAAATAKGATISMAARTLFVDAPVASVLDID